LPRKRAAIKKAEVAAKWCACAVSAAPNRWAVAVPNVAASRARGKGNQVAYAVKTVTQRVVGR